MVKELDDAESVVSEHRRALLNPKTRDDPEKQKAVVLAMTRLCVYTVAAIGNAVRDDN